MATIIADNIISPLGFTTKSNIEAVMSGLSSLYHYDRMRGIPFPFTASLFSGEQRGKLLLSGYTFFESLAIQSIRDALLNISVPLDERTILIISSTKLNIDLLKECENGSNVLSPGFVALKIAQAVGIKTTPVVVSNACISGVSAMILGKRLLDLGLYDYAIVCGVDVQSPFIISGFQSFKALSEESCRPFDIERLGLNLGEGAATVVLSRLPKDNVSNWHIKKGAMKNDAYHTTSPSPQGEGCLKSIQSVVAGIDVDCLALINAHGTATMYNDQMESKAISQSGLSKIPLNALKGYYGHTMGAAGILETVVTMHSLDKGIILGTKGFDELGVSENVNIISTNTETKKIDFLKIISGFGGCNAAILLSHEEMKNAILPLSDIQIVHRLVLHPEKLEIDGVEQDIRTDGINILNHLYKNRIGNYSKFYKMDGLARLGFVVSELLLAQEGKEHFVKNEKRAIVFFNKHASIHADIEYFKTISDEDNFYPSPSEFVYTLPNIVNGEIAIRNGYCGETCFYVLPEKDERRMKEILQATFLDGNVDSILTGWIEYQSDKDFEAEIFIIKK